MQKAFLVIICFFQKAKFSRICLMRKAISVAKIGIISETTKKSGGKMHQSTSFRFDDSFGIPSSDTFHLAMLEMA